MLINIHRRDNNVGDIMSSPLLYFNFPQETKTIDIMDLDNPETLNNDIIIGGGGLVARDFFSEKMNYIADHKKGKLISWGIGHNSYEDLGGNLKYPNYMSKFDLHGIRDYNQGFNYLPCVSCMSQLFDKKYDVKHEFVIYQHANPQWKIPPNPRNFPVMVNNKLNNKQGLVEKISNLLFTPIDDFQLSFSKIIKFLGEADTILTNTYHGMYWGILLNKKVLAFPFSTKFYTLKYKVPFCEPNNWQEKLQYVQTYPEALEECRNANQLYYQEVLKLIN
ncbi:polysaccharide pyruvyl transferase family protein [Anabaena sp. UHCC 0399]|uniref:polysaccharide pyruvyl transferase family protein n=1 Tax=Anabaena sp. UHCC 0399 TaxID=3110238 RepID=UPI002B21DDF7|nr:polysaccharide pyruvyl transferase family protein [Anabaena sp. UHCC 0399]MEA5565345.1 polysaccharide pyruvyl transferase family protein [Anabaena sp. UHCC 0399]